MATDFGFRAYDAERCTDPFVFISYKSEDYEQVGVYARHLRENGINVWYDEGLHSGVDWESYLMSVIEKPHCKAVLLFLSAKVAQSTVIPLETTQARACKKPTVAVHLEPGLDIEALLNKAIKIYVEQRQSVKAYAGTPESVCAEVLSAARNAMSSAAAVSTSSVDTLYKNAQMFMMNFRRSESSEDLERARKYFTQMTEDEPYDHRGWLGLALCACMRRPESCSGALEQLRECAKYYSYIVTAGADNIASPEYTAAKSRLWQDILGIMRRELELCTDLSHAEQLHEQAALLGNHFGHTEPGLRGEYERLSADMEQRIVVLREERLERQKAEEEKQRRAEQERLKAKKAEEAAAELRERISQCKWEPVSGGGISLKKYRGNSASYDIPSEVDGHRVTSIGNEAFYDCTSLTSVTIPNSVTSIGESAFERCTSLTSVTIPNGVTTIGDWTFRNCTNLTSVTIPNSVTSVGNNAFYDCTSLTSVTIPNSVTSIGNWTFRGCTNLTSVTIPNSVTSIGEYAFYGCTGLTSIVVPDRVTSIGYCAFYYCTGLTSIIIPASVTSFGKNIFKGCKNLTVYGTGGFFSKVRRAARKCHVKYKKI